MTQTISFHYESSCVMPQCICVGAAVFLMLKGTALTEDGKPYVNGTVDSITLVGSGGYDVVISYDDSTLGELEVSFGAEGTACDPDCGDECSWLWKVKRLTESITNPPTVNRHYQLYAAGQWVEDGVFDIPRIPFVTGYRLTALHLSCFVYDENTTITAVLRVGSTVIGEYSGPLGEQAVMTIDVTDLEYDELPVLTISGTESAIYEDAAKGLVIELLGIIIPV